MVQSDEWAYSSFSRLIPFNEAQLPSYLYFSIFHLTNYCGDGFLACARALNVLLFLAAAPFIYLVARNYMSGKLSGFIAIMSVCGPLNTYTAYFMPEATYFLAFWVITWAAFQFRAAPTSKRCAVLGITIALASMIKIHALFLLPALLLFILYTAYATYSGNGNSTWLRTGLRLISIALASAALVRFGIGALYAGKNGLDLLGTLYRNQAAGTAHPTMQHLLELTLVSASGHAMGLIVLFGVPLAATLVYPMNRTESKSTTTALLLYLLLMLGSLLAITVMFTATVVGLYDSITRLHMRYYDFIIPLFLIFAGSQLSRNSSEPPIIKKLIIGTMIAIAIIYSRYFLLEQFSPSIIDCPDLNGLSIKHIFNQFTVLAVFCIAAWITNNKLGIKLFLYVFMPIYTILTSIAIAHTFRSSMAPDIYERAGIYVHDHLSKDEIAKVIVIGADDAGLFKSKFHMDNPKVDLQSTPKGQPIDISRFAHDKHWLLIIGDYPSIPNVLSRQDSGDYSLLLIANEDGTIPPIDFSKPLAGGDLVHIKGLSNPESWGGSWSIDDNVELKFDTALPKKLTLHLTADAYGPNIGQNFVIMIGASRQTFNLTNEARELIFNMETDGAQHVITIEIPQPTSPKQLGISEDARRLGIAMIRMKIE
ncbi:DUF7024 domain-containing protein [Solimicrobium silvestre]|nr:hypothetical protein [Solimicrobium silvestre]